MLSHGYKSPPPSPAKHTFQSPPQKPEHFVRSRQATPRPAPPAYPPSLWGASLDCWLGWLAPEGGDQESATSRVCVCVNVCHIPCTIAMGQQDACTHTRTHAHTLCHVTHRQTDTHQHGCVRAQTSPHTRENKSRKTRTSGNLVDVIETLLDAFLQDRLHACMRERYVCAYVCPCVCERKKEAAYHKGVASSAPAIIFHLCSCWQHECSYPHM